MESIWYRVRFLQNFLIYKCVGQYYALSRTIVGRARIKASDGRPAELDNL
jgi:hypothetical protein